MGKKNREDRRPPHQNKYKSKIGQPKPKPIGSEPFVHPTEPRELPQDDGERANSFAPTSRHHFLAGTLSQPLAYLVIHDPVAKEALVYSSMNPIRLQEQLEAHRFSVDGTIPANGRAVTILRDVAAEEIGAVLGTNNQGLISRPFSTSLAGPLAKLTLDQGVIDYLRHEGGTSKDGYAPPAAALIIVNNMAASEPSFPYEDDAAIRWTVEIDNPDHQYIVIVGGQGRMSDLVKAKAIPGRKLIGGDTRRNGEFYAVFQTDVHPKQWREQLGISKERVFHEPCPGAQELLEARYQEERSNPRNRITLAVRGYMDFLRK